MQPICNRVYVLFRLSEESEIDYYRTIFLDRKIAIFRDLQNLGMTCLNCLECGSENIVMGCIRIFRQYKEVRNEPENMDRLD